MSLTLTNARLHWDDDGLPHSLDYGDIYYSRADALGESSHVFLDGNDLPARFAATTGTFTVGELGFGAGLNFLNCCRAFCNRAPAGAALHYVACELHPFTRDDLARWLGRFDELAPWREALLQACPDHTAGVHQLVLRQPQHRIVLTLLYGDAARMLADYGRSNELKVDAWFLDGFSPKRNPELWQATLMQEVGRLSKHHTTLSSYSVAAPLKRALQVAGFDFHKTAGFTGKRQMLQARYTTTQALTRNSPGEVIIVGGGLSGCSTAFALAETGWRVTLIESGPALAAQGSGNLQGVLHCKPGTADSADNLLNLHAYLFAQRHYSALADRGLPWHQCGMLHVGVDDEQVRRFGRIVQSGRFHPSILQAVDAAAASQLAGITLTHPCLFFPLSGWLAPATLCEFYARHPAIKVRTGTSVNTLQQNAQGLWQIGLASGETMTSPAVVLCNAADAYAFPQCRKLPIISNRGQVDVYASSALTDVRTVLCGQGYLIPASNGRQSVGGSYYVEATTPEQNRLTHLKLVKRMDTRLAQALAEQRPLEQRIGQRCQTPDRMPLAGLVSPEYHGLYINAAHGSNGLARTPISAALLAAMMNGTPLPLPDRLHRLVDPTRFR